MVDAAAFYDNNANSEWQKPTLESLEAESDVVEMGEGSQSAELSDEQCLLAAGVVYGFDLKTKDWCKWTPGL